jgi:copper chaperone CopZ
MTETKTFQIPAIGCNGCVNTIKGELGEMEGVISVDGVVATKTITVTFGAPVTLASLVERLKEIEYAPAEG